MSNKRQKKECTKITCTFYLQRSRRSLAKIKIASKGILGLVVNC